MSFKRIIIIGAIICGFTVACNAQRVFFHDVDMSLEIRDQSYYERLDEIAQREYDRNVDELTKAFTYFDDGDYESAIYWAKKTNFIKYNWGCQVYPLLTLSYANMKDKRNTKKWYKFVENNCGEPIRVRMVQRHLEKLNMKY